MFDQAALEAYMLSGEDFTYMGTCLKFHGSTADPGRIVDKTIQRFRRQQLIAFRREKGNRSPIWSAVNKTARAPH
jgi:hypothetical protein